MYKKINGFLSGKSMSSGTCLKSESGDVPFETSEIMKRWKEYVEKLFDDCHCEAYICELLQGPEIIKDEVNQAIKSMRCGKAIGIDNISTEMVLALGEFGTDSSNIM